MSVSLSVGDDVIRPILEAKIRAAIVAELGKEYVIQDSTRQAVKDWAESHKQQIADEMLKQMRTKKFTAHFVNQVLEGMTQELGSSWRLNVSFPER